MFGVHFIFDFAKRWSKSRSKLLKKDFTERIAKEVVIKVFYRAPRRDVASTTFRDESMDMRIPFQVTSKGVKNTDKTRGKIFGFIHFGKHTEDNIANGVKETVKEGSILEEIDTKFFRNGENTMTMNTSDKLARHMKRAFLVVTIATRRAKTTLATESDKFQISTVRAAIHGTAIGRVTTMKHLVDVFDNRSARMKFVNHIFIIIIKDRL